MIEPSEHPKPVALRESLRSTGAPAAVEAVRRHLLAGCLPCLLRARSALREIRAAETEHSPLDLSGDVPSWAGRMAARAERMLLLIEAERRVAGELAADLLELPRAERRMAVERGPGGFERFRLYGLAEHLMQETRGLRFRGGRRATEIAETAVLVAESLDPELYPPGLSADAEALAWAALGNARRVQGELEAADRALTIAADHLEEGVGNLLDQAEIRSLLGSLRIDQGRFEEASEILREVCTIYRREDRPRLEAKTLVKIARCAFEAGRPGEAIGVFERAASRLDPRGDPRLLALALHGKATCLADTGRAEEAAALFSQVRRVFMREFTEPRGRLRIDWLEAKIARGLGDVERAVEAFEAARRGFEEVKAPFDSAVVTLELAGVHLEQGRVGDVRRLAGEILGIFSTFRDHRHTVRALDLARKTAAR